MQEQVGFNLAEEVRHTHPTVQELALAFDLAILQNAHRCGWLAPPCESLSGRVDPIPAPPTITSHQAGLTSQSSDASDPGCERFEIWPTAWSRLLAVPGVHGSKLLAKFRTAHILGLRHRCFER
jgi:hypothetical protein